MLAQLSYGKYYKLALNAQGGYFSINNPKGNDMFNAIASTLMIATRTNKEADTFEAHYRHEERKREELNRLKTNTYFHPTTPRLD
jgi:hypothetical protein